MLYSPLSTDTACFGLSKEVLCIHRGTYYNRPALAILASRYIDNMNREKIEVGSTITVSKWGGVAFRVVDVIGSEVTAIMVGDDKKHYFDIARVALIAEGAFCSECGQLGCFHNTIK